MDLSQFSPDELRALQTKIGQELHNRKQHEIAQAREQILAIARGVGLPLEELAGKDVRATRQPVSAKYQNPTSSEQQWSGRGRQPKWVKDWLASGRGLHELKI